MVIDTQFTRTDVFQINGTTETTRNDIGINNGNFFFGVSSTSMTTTQTADTNRHTFFIDCPNGSYGLDGNTLATVTPYTGADGTRNILLFARWATNKEAYCYEKMYSAKIYVSDVLVRDFVPVLDSNNVACLLDQVENKFYYNKGTGTFTYGTAGTPVVADVARKIKKGYVGIKSTYTPVEYIESSGTQYIDTGYSANSNTKLELKLQFTSASHQEFIFCGRDFNNGSTINAFSLFRNTSNQFRADYNSIGTLFSHTVTANNDYTYVMDKNKLYENNVLIRTETSASFSATNKLRLFSAFNSDGTINNFFEGKVFYCKILDNDTLVRDFIPVLDENNVACLYEQVEGKFYYNQGSGIFTAGSATGEPVSLGGRARRIKKGYVGVSGVARLCFGSNYPTLDTAISNSDQVYNPMVTNTDDYILIAGGTKTNGGNPVKTVTAYNSNLIATAAADMSYQAHLGTAAYFNGYGIVAGGKTAWSGGSGRSARCMAFNNNLARTDLTTIYDGVYEPASAANSTHCIIEGGCYYNGDSSSACSYNTSLVKTSLTSMSGTRRSNSAATVGDYIVCIASGLSTNIATDFYDNSNVKTTGTSAYSKYNWNPLGLSTDSYAIFFGGSTSQGNSNYAYTDCKAYDKNKVLTTFNLPSAVAGAGGFSDTDYAMCCYGNNAYIYDDNLVLQETLSGSFGGISFSKTGTHIDKIGMVNVESSSTINVFDI